MEIPTPKLLDDERAQAIARKDVITKATLEIEKVLIAHNLSMDDLGEIVSTFNARGQAVFSRMKVGEIKSLFDKI